MVINVAGAEHTVSRALACLVAGMSFLEARGQIVALLPAGCLHSEKDAAVWTTLRRKWNVSLVRECQRNTFDSFYPSTVLLHLYRRSDIVVPEAEAIKAPLRGTVLLVRGKVQMHSVIPNGSGLAPVLHTTDLSPGPRGKPEATFKEVGNGTVEGLCIVLPRVGCPDMKKLVLRRFAEATRLSDCLFGLQCADDCETELLFQAMRSEWSVLCKLYVGTGATFLTLQRLTGFLMRLDYKTEAVQNIRLRGEDTFKNDQEEQTRAQY